MSGYGDKGKGKGKSSRQSAEAGHAPLQAINVKLVNLNGEVIFDKMELKGTEKISDIIDKVQKALGHGVDLVTTNGDKLPKDKSIEESGLEDGSTITALLK